MLAGDDSTFRDSFAALLDLFKEFAQGTGTMFVIASPCSEPPNRLVPALVNDRPDLVREHDDPASRCVLNKPCIWLSSHHGRSITDIYMHNPAQILRPAYDVSSSALVTLSVSADRTSISQHIAQIYILHPLFRCDPTSSMSNDTVIRFCDSMRALMYDVPTVMLCIVTGASSGLCLYHSYAGGSMRLCGRSRTRTRPLRICQSSSTCSARSSQWT